MSHGAGGAASRHPGAAGSPTPAPCLRREPFATECCRWRRLAPLPGRLSPRRLRASAPVGGASMRTRILTLGLAVVVVLAVGLIPAAGGAARQTTSTAPVAPGCGPQGGQGLILYQSFAPFTPEAGLKADLVVAT